MSLFDVAEAPKRITSDADGWAFLDAHGITRESLGSWVVQTERGVRIRVPNPCGRCGGGGWLAQFSGMGPGLPDGGICYDCRGADTRERVISYTPKGYAQNERKRLRAADRRRERQRARIHRQEEGQRSWCERNGHGPITFAELDAKRMRERDARRETERATSRHVGTVKVRETFAGLELVALPSWENRWGTQYCHVFKDGDGNRLVWITGEPIMLTAFDEEWGRDMTRPIQPGQTVDLVATVKKHGEREGVAETHLARCKVAGD